MNTQAEADKLIAEARMILFNNFPNANLNAMDRLIDCIIGAAVLEVASLTEKAHGELLPKE